MRLKKGSVLCALVFLLAGCATSKEALLPAGNSDMMAIWSGRQADPDSADSRTVTETARSVLRRALTNDEAARRQQANTAYTRTQHSEIHQQFPRLPNPDMVMYVFPHLSAGNLPVPGYSTVFPFYHQVQYALPGERVEGL
ncbi:TIGR03751 family conjugal transfer lipoprotein [Klebsiella pneumoniae subsp. pneumoniae]|nr:MULTISPECIES: TIGR03751 family conjugal transfer lipoprotein [Enterobacterales]HAG5568430.1 TIGR03751 family conjugal transfer lipoprotein [Salmonella enterica]HBD3034025.1 TIGR03751 family conjugal transfer lipoprotein [Citrobacter koseri]HDJ1973693.1 TIGR03751 family conjugal transfer lipoprotein [Salmonella enterica subsp. enterica]EKW5280030.1 TIGR03751 family conjugal transfer lipoprotein [Klebsiella pneumoniae]EKX4459257.1 TIGR03751 family conjugal transfer lipoprotein [Proteus mirabi